jgi:hypothetical protein
VVVVHGFANPVQALQWEWAWQHPDLSLRVRGAIGDSAACQLKRKRGVSGQLKVLQTLLFDCCDHTIHEKLPFDNSKEMSQETSQVKSQDSAKMRDGDDGNESDGENTLESPVASKTKSDKTNAVGDDDGDGDAESDGDDEDASSVGSDIQQHQSMDSSTPSLSLYFLEQSYLDTFLKIIGVGSADECSVPCHVSTFQNMPFWADRKNLVPIQRPEEKNESAVDEVTDQAMIESEIVDGIGGQEENPVTTPVPPVKQTNKSRKTGGAGTCIDLASCSSSSSGKSNRSNGTVDAIEIKDDDNSVVDNDSILIDDCDDETETENSDDDSSKNINKGAEEESEDDMEMVNSITCAYCVKEVVYSDKTVICNECESVIHDTCLDLQEQAEWYVYSSFYRTDLTVR